MVRKIKVLMTLFVVASLFLPLATCTQNPPPYKSNAEPIIVERFAIEERETVWATWGLAILFGLPLLLALLDLALKPHSAGLNVVETILGMVISGVVAFYAFTSQLAVGGYLALIGVIGILVLAIAAMIDALRSGREARRDEAGS
ncbi:Uncharacterised protein [BD1-7 clade bacterium]|uniref:Uncharacterized protein n=1 Tax=BD1-7 clade bacterium TaxID=2029982 RepID=A0A5S9R0U3_9GAMM|nr:Uncharacterised protein [BD1-7 clade bacterium]